MTANSPPPVGTDLIPVLTEFMQDSLPLGTVFPPRSNAPGLPDKGARECALRRLRELIARLPFMRTMEGDLVQPFRVPLDQIHLYRPNNTPDGERLPTIAFLPAPADKSADNSWLGPSILIDGTEDLFAPDTALFYVGDHSEVFQIEVKAEHHAVRRAIVAGLEQVFRYSEEGTILRLGLPEYFDQTATFTLQRTTYLEEDDAVRNRRRALIDVLLYVPDVVLANAVDQKTFVTVIAGVQVDTSVDVES